MAQQMGPGHTIVTILCDSGMRHLSKFYNAEYLAQYGLTPSASGLEFLGISSGKKFFQIIFSHMGYLVETLEPHTFDIIFFFY